MKQSKFTILIFAVLFSLTSASFAQSTSTQGTEFWVSFMTNGHKYHTAAPNNGNWILTQVLISGQRDCSVTLTNPQTGWTETHQVQANNITTIDIDEDVAYVDGISEQVMNKGLQITSTDTVSVFCTNIAHLSFDASYVLPTQSLADDYIIQTYDQSHYSSNLNYQTQNQTSAFLIVATEDHTVVDITPSVPTLNGHGSGNEFTITLNKGQAYQVRSNRNDGPVYNRDLSGSRVTARNCKRIAVFNGNTLTAIPSQESSYDHVFEQAMPVQSWGKQFVVTKSLERSYDVVKIISASDDNEIYKNGESIATINTGESYSFDLTGNNNSCFIETSGRAAVYLYNRSRDGNSIGDPSVVWIAPVEQRIDRITFSTFNNENINIDTHHVNIIVNTEDVGDVFLDNQRIPSNEFSPVTGNNEFSFARKDIQHGVHHLQCDHGFNAHVYGFGIAKGYAYLVGSKTEDLTVKVELNGTLVQPNDTVEHCVSDPILFDAAVSLSNYDLLWNFGDGTTSTQNPVTHNYSNKDFYEVSLIITTDEVGGCVFSTSDTLRFYVDSRQKYTTEDVEVCKGELYAEHGFNVIVTNDTILGKAIDNPEHPHCPDSLLVYITALPGYYAAYNETRCWTNEPFTYTDHGFDLLIDHPSTYTEQITASIPGGCDSIIDLTLTVTDRIVNPNPIEYSGCSESFTWNGVTYNASGDYEQVFTSALGCDSIIELHIFLDEILEGDTDTVRGVCTAYEWHGHLYDLSGLYTDTIPSAAGCDSIVHLDLVLDEIYEGGTDTVRGICTAYEWHGHLYDQTGFYTDTIPSAAGCDSIVHLDLSMMHDDLSEIHPMDTVTDTPHWVITTTDFEIHSYDFTIWDSSPGIVWDSVEWNFETNNNNWILEPWGSPATQCRVYVLTHVEDTVWLTAEVFNECYPEGKTLRYWLLSSFYGIDESSSADFSISPNPNSGQMQLNLKNLIGETSIKVIDMKGKIVDQFQISNYFEAYSMPYVCKCKASGIYLFVLTNEGRNYTRKVSIANE